MQWDACGSRAHTDPVRSLYIATQEAKPRGRGMGSAGNPGPDGGPDGLQRRAEHSTGGGGFPAASESEACDRGG